MPSTSQSQAQSEGKSASVGVNTHDLCEAAVDYVLSHSNTIQYLLQSIEGVAEAPFPRSRLKCLPSAPRRKSGELQLQLQGPDPERVAAGYMWRRARPDCQKGDVVLVEERLVKFKTADKEGDAPRTRADINAGYLESRQQAVLSEVERNLRHELVHAFDDARGFVESADCTHQACSEIRAARLSGDCFVGNEAKKGRFDFFQGGMQCVRRRATMAVEMNPVCRGFSDRAVETVFRACYSDYEPFAAPVYALGSYGEGTYSSAAWQPPREGREE